MKLANGDRRMHTCRVAPPVYMIGRGELPPGPAPDRESSLDRTMGRQGFSLIEVILAAVIVSILATITLPQITQGVARVAVRSAAATFTAKYSLTRTLAIRQGSEARLVVDVGKNTFWVAVDTSSGGAQVWDTIGTPVDLTENHVTMVTSSITYCFNGRGLAKIGLACPNGAGAVSFTRGSHADTLFITPLGKILR